MKKYISFFRIRVINGLQYRAAAYAGIVTQLAWGGLAILMYRAFYLSGTGSLPMSMQELSTYIWLQQAFLTLFMPWLFDNELFDSITGGNIAYELCRPADMYYMWFIKNAAMRVARMLLRFAPVLIIAAFLPVPYNMTLPVSIVSGVAFIFSLIIGFLVIVAFLMLIYISAFYTVSAQGTRMLAMTVIDFLTGGVIPLPFFPEGFRTVAYLLPFASMQNTPYLIYTGYISGINIIYSILLQLFWLAVLLAAGKAWMQKAISRVVVQGG